MCPGDLSVREFREIYLIPAPQQRQKQGGQTILSIDCNGTNPEPAGVGHQVAWYRFPTIVRLSFSHCGCHFLIVTVAGMLLLSFSRWGCHSLKMSVSAVGWLPLGVGISGGGCLWGWVSLEVGTRVRGEVTDEPGPFHVTEASGHYLRRRIPLLPPLSAAATTGRRRRRLPPSSRRLLQPCVVAAPAAARATGGYFSSLPLPPGSGGRGKVTSGHWAGLV